MAPLLRLCGARPPHAMCGRRARKDAVTRTKMLKKNTCGGFAKKFLKQLRYKRSMIIKANSKDKNAAKKRLKKDLRGDSDFKEKFERASREAFHPNPAPGPKAGISPPEGGWAVQDQPCDIGPCERIEE